jgi:hypothetical protein
MGWEVSIGEGAWKKCTKADAEKRIVSDSKKYKYDPIKMIKLLEEESPKSLIVGKVKRASETRFTRVKYRRL